MLVSFVTNGQYKKTKVFSKGHYKLDLRFSSLVCFVLCVLGLFGWLYGLSGFDARCPNENSRKPKRRKGKKAMFDAVFVWVTFKMVHKSRGCNREKSVDGMQFSCYCFIVGDVLFTLLVLTYWMLCLRLTL